MADYFGKKRASQVLSFITDICVSGRCCIIKVTRIEIKQTIARPIRSSIFYIDLGSQHFYIPQPLGSDAIL